MSSFMETWKRKSTWRFPQDSILIMKRISVEAEFQAMTYDICERLWMKIILDDLKVKYEEPMKLFCDNNSIISIAHNPVHHNRIKHIKIDKHFIKEKLLEMEMVTGYIYSLAIVASRVKGPLRQMEMVKYGIME
ncbi:Copia protein, partial [Mucuna pruriens]